MRFLKFIPVIFLILCISSCTDHDVGKNTHSIFPIKPGNYWVYRISVTSADGVLSVFSYLDSVWIVNDTIIDNKKYWKEISTLRGNYYLRDSGNCVLRREATYEQIIYSTNMDTLVKDPPTYKINTNVNEVTKVPAGDFVTINFRTLVRKTGLGEGHSDLPSFNKDFFTDEQFISNSKTGIVKYVYYYLGGEVKHELVRYKLN